ncbi:MAG: DNA-processing protein DprA [Candidatus Promineifilaceae bacterium]
MKVTNPECYWLALAHLPGVGGETVKRWLVRLGSVEAMFAAADLTLLALPRFTPVLLAQLRTLTPERLEAEWQQLTQAGIRLLTWDDPTYPALLQRISSAPPVLFIQGEWWPTDESAVAIVGTRQASDAGLRLARCLGKELAERGLTVVSGLASGIDTQAHWGALQAPCGRTLAVLGSGLQAIHPPGNEALAQQIRTRGALLSEVQPTALVSNTQLVARDRLISGLSQALIVVEAPAKSGALYAAANAQKQDRLLFAVPGTAGCEALIRQGAIPLTPSTLDMDHLSRQIRAYTLPARPLAIPLL